MMNWRIYNPDKTLAGLEARFRIKDNVLQIELCGANHKKDWIDSIFGAFKRIKMFDNKYNSRYFAMAKMLYFHLFNLIDSDDVQRTEIRGHSMGGAVATILSDTISERNLHDVRSLKFGCPRSGSKNKVVWINKGELAHLWPFWYPKYRVLYSNKKWQWPWKAHNSYNWRFDR